MFLPLRVRAVGRGRGRPLHHGRRPGAGRAPTSARGPTARAGVLVFCHEYLSDRWSFRPYADHLRDLGFDLFTFDFRNHGESAGRARLQAAPVGDRPRGQRPPRGARLPAVAARPRPGRLRPLRRQPGRRRRPCWSPPTSPTSGESITDGAFPTRGTMLAYILRWAEIFVGNRYLWKYMPVSVFRFLGVGRPAALGAAAQLPVPRRRAGGRPAGPPALADDPRREGCLHRPRDRRRASSTAAREPKEIVDRPGAKHNRCREVEPEAYAARIASFFRGTPLAARSVRPARPRRSCPRRRGPGRRRPKAVRIPRHARWRAGGPVHGRT